MHFVVSYFLFCSLQVSHFSAVLHFCFLACSADFPYQKHQKVEWWRRRVEYAVIILPLLSVVRQQTQM